MRSLAGELLPGNISTQGWQRVALQDLMRERGDRRSQAEMKGYVTREEQGPKEFPEHQLERMNGSTIRIQRKNRSN